MGSPISCWRNSVVAINTHMTATFQVENIIGIREEMMPLIHRHRDEVNFWKETPLDINWSRYAGAQNNGAYVLVTCRTDGQLVGWIGYWVGTHTRHHSMNMAREDWYYIMPEYRGRGWGRELFQRAEDYLEELAVDRIVMSTKITHDHSALLDDLGYTEYERHYTKKLEK